MPKDSVVEPDDEKTVMNQSFLLSSSLKPPQNEHDIEDCECTLLEDAENDSSHSAAKRPDTILQGLNDSRTSSIVTTGDWEEQECWLASMANSDSCPVSSSSGTSPQTGTFSQGVSPGIAVHLDQSFPFGISEDIHKPSSSQSLSSISDVLQVEKDFMDYVMSFPPVTAQPPIMITASTVNSRRPQNDPKVGLDHLDNLCKLMEQLSDLKESNIKLKRRVQYLEDIKTLHEIHKEMVGERTLYSSGVSDEDALRVRDKSDELRKTPENSPQQLNPDDLRFNGLYRSKTANLVPSSGEYKFEREHKSRSVSSNKERRERSKSVGHAKTTKKHPSRWSKVKEVLGIEKTDDQSTTLEAEKSDEHSGGKHYERRERSSVRSPRKDNDHPKTHKLSASKSHSNILSSRSFTEISRQSPADSGLKKSPKTPWGKMKTMIQIRRDNRQKSESSSSSPMDPKATKPGQIDAVNSNGHHNSSKRALSRSSHRPFHPEATSGQSEKYGEDPRDEFFNHSKFENTRQDQSPRHHQQKHRRSNSHLEADTKSKGDREGISTASKQEDCYANSALLSNKEIGKKKKPKIRPLPLDNDPQTLYPDEESRGTPRSPGCSPLSQRKWMWTRMKDALKGKKEESEHIPCSVPSSPVSVTEGTAFDFEVLDKTEDSSINSALQSNRASESGPDQALSCSSPSSTVTELLRELQQNLSDDFNKKLEEWQRCRVEGTAIKGPPSPVVERKDSFGRLRKISKPEKKVSTSDKLTKSNYHVQKKDLNWLEKEHQKVEREIVRLSKEKEKFEKRALRLLHLKEAMLEGDGLKKEVLVKTSAGEFRFEGISDAFTKKLYEWETKKGVGPELSTIALLDESLKPNIESTLSPNVISQQVGTSSTRTTPEPKNCYQVSRASSEPDLFSSCQKDSGSVSGHQATRSKSGDTLLSGDKEMVASLEEDISRDVRLESPREVIAHHGDDNYYTLLEENMYLLDQLKEKEEICCHLQNELDRLDDRTEKTNRTHQEEMEKYRQKLWEIHMSRPRDLQGSLQLISELKHRIEDLQNCSDKLKSDREQLEESFRYHSDQQARLADDLIRRVRELQEAPMVLGRGGCRRKWRKMLKCDSASVSRIHDLSTKLLQQARDVEQSLMDRTRQVCHLRWELLHRDMSAVLLQAALHRVTSQGEPLSILPTWDKRRDKFKSLKAWSVDATNRCQFQDGMADEWLQDRLRQLSMTPHSDWVGIDFTPTDLMTTAHELKRETLKLSIIRPDRVSDSEDKKSATCSADSEPADSDRCYDTHSRSSSLSSGGAGGLRGSHSDTRLYERARALRRRSSSSMSCADASDSSSLHDSDRVHHSGTKRFPWRTQWRSLDNVSSSCSSRSSVLEDDSVRMHWRQPKSFGRMESLAHDETTACGPLQLKYGSFKEVDEENEEPKMEVIPKSSDWTSKCLITPRSIPLGKVSDSERERQRRFQGSQKKFFDRNPVSTVEKIIEPPPMPLYGRLISQNFDSTISRTSCTSHESMMREFREFTSSASSSLEPKNNTEGSLESLDKYETAIRDEDLFSDEHSARSCDERREIFSDFEDSKLKASENEHLQSLVDCQNAPSNYGLRDRAVDSAIECSDHQSTPGSPNISKFKYKGTKGFGRSARHAFNDDLTIRPHKCQSPDDLRPSESEILHLDV